MKAPTGMIIRNKFFNNIGDGGSVRLYNNFDEIHPSSMILSNDPFGKISVIIVGFGLPLKFLSENPINFIIAG